MTRRPRRQSESGYYHVYARGSGRQIIYRDDCDRRRFLGALESAAADSSTELLAYCLMSNHYHLVVNAEYEQLAAFGYALNRTYATYYNDRHDRTGHLFQGRFSSQPIDEESYLLAAVRYVHRNPVEAKMTHTPNYIWNSYAAYLGDSANPIDSIIKTDLVLGMLGGLEAFVEFHSHPGKEVFADDHPYPVRVATADIPEIARTALQGADPVSLKSLAKPDRNDALKRLKLANLTISQISTLTGISRSTICRA